MSALQGIRVDRDGRAGAGAVLRLILADFGADVVRVDRVGAGSMDQLARGKRSVAVNLKSPEGVETVLRLAEKADVLLEPYRPGVMERLGLGPDVACARNPRLVYARLTGFGQDGPYASMAGHDINYIAISGALSLLGRKGEKPLPPVNLLGDFAGGGMLCALGICLALLERGHSGTRPGRRRGDGRRRRLPQPPSSTSSATPGCGATSAAPTCSTPARPSTTPIAPRTAQYRVGRRHRAAVLRRPARTGSASTPPPCRTRWTSRSGRRPRRGSPRSSPPRRATSGARSSTAPTPASRPILGLGEVARPPAQSRPPAPHRRSPGQARAGTGAAPVAHAGRRDAAAAAGRRAHARRAGRVRIRPRRDRPPGRQRRGCLIAARPRRVIAGHLPEQPGGKKLLPLRHVLA